MTESQRESLHLREYIGVLKARKWSIALITLLIVASALAVSFAQTPLYGATARLLVVPPGADVATNPVNYIVTEAQLLSSEPVAELVIEDLGLLTSAGALLQGLTVSDVPEASVLNVTFTSQDPELARDVPNSFASNYITYKQQRALEETRRLQQAVQEEIDELTAELRRISDRLEEARGRQDAALSSSLQDQRTVLLAQLGVLQQQLNAVAPDQALPQAGEVIQAAQLPRRPSSPNHIKNGVFAALLGFALAVGLAFLRDRLEDKIKTRNDAEVAVGVPVLATIPWVGSRRSGRRKKVPKELISISNPKALASEAYRSLSTNLQFIMTQRSIKSVLVTSAATAEGKTITSSNLAVAMAQAGKRVILVSGDMRRPTLEEGFGLERNRGLSNWLMGEETELTGLIRDPGITNLRVLPSGVIPANPAELLTSINVTRLIRTLEANSDLVIVDAPPVLAVADASVISSVVDGVLMVLHGSSTHRSSVIRAKEEIERSGGEPIGIVLNAWDETGSASYYYGSAYQESSPNTETIGSLREPDAEGASGKRRRSRLGLKS